MRNKDKEKIINKVLDGKIENNLEKEIYLEYLNKQLIKLENKYKEEKRNNFRAMFKNWLDYYIKFHFTYSYAPILSICFANLAVGLPYELNNLHINFMKSYSFRIFIFLALIPSMSSLIKSITKNYLPNKKIIKKNFLKKENDLKEEIDNVKEMQFEKENIEENKEILNITSGERYILNVKEKTKIYEKINYLLIKIKEISDANIKSKFALELTSIVMDFDNKRINLENLNPDNQNLIIDNKINIELSISLRLNNLENQINSFLNKESRMEEDTIKVKSILEELKPLTRN